MKFDLGAVGLILMGVAALALLIFAGYRIFSTPQLRQRQRMSGAPSAQPLTSKDRELLALIGDLAELYRSTGR